MGEALGRGGFGGGAEHAARACCSSLPAGHTRVTVHVAIGTIRRIPIRQPDPAPSAAPRTAISRLLSADVADLE